MANTFNDMVNEVKAKLAGYTLKQDRITYLKSAIDNVVVSIPLGSSDNLAKGLIEIDDELIWVDSFNTATTTLNAIPGLGRGFQGTTAASHNINSLVFMTPNFPRTLVKQAINDTILSLFPKLYAVKHTTITSSGAINTFALPADVQDVISASWQSIGPRKEWLLLKRFRVDTMSNATAWGSLNSISIYDSIPSGRTIDIVYTSLPTALAGNTDDFVTTVGLPVSCWDIVVLGACSRLLAFIDAGRINVTSAEADLADSKIPPSAGQTLGKFVYALYQQRLTEESNKMQDHYRFAPHYIS